MQKDTKNRFQIVVDQLVEEVQVSCKQRRLGEKDVPKLQASVSKLIADSVAITKGRKQRRWASIHLNSLHYTASRYHNSDITYRIHVGRAYETLVELKYLTEVKAGVYSETNRFLTRYEATDKLIDLFSDAERVALHQSAPMRDDAELIRVQLRDENNRKYLADYDENDDTIRMREQVAFINSVLAKNEFDLEMTSDELETLEDRMHQRSKERNEGDGRLRLQDSSLYRVFNDTDFTNGGRFYGGWWQVIPSEYRTRIRINEKRTVELDFGTLHPTMLYSEVGLKPPEDSYQIGLFPRSSTGMASLEAYRQLVKRCFNAMLNAKHPLKRPPRDVDLSAWGLKWDQIVEAIFERHKPIADQFFTGRGLLLQREDSDIAGNVMEDFARRMGLVPLLPVHDSFICHHGYENDVHIAMKREFKKRYGTTVAVKVKRWEDDLTHLAYRPDESSAFDEDIIELAEAFK